MIYEKEHRENPFVKKSGAGVELQHQLYLHPFISYHANFFSK